MDLDTCPHCRYRLSSAIAKYEDIDWIQQVWLHDSLNTLLTISYNHLNPADIATSLLYVLGGCYDTFDRKAVECALPSSIKLPTLLQYARDSLAQKRTLHLSFLLSVLFVHNVRMNEFLNLKVPQSFVNSLHKERTRRNEQLSCQAPWCSGYCLPGTLVKTGTTLKRCTSGEIYRYYMACMECGCEYAVDEHGDLRERTYFIDGYRVLSQVHLPITSMKSVARQNNMTEDKLQRCIAYFATRRSLDMPDRLLTINPNLLEKYVDAIRSGQTIKNIQTWPDWSSYNEFLLYRYHSEVIKELIVQKRPRPSKRADRSQNWVVIKKAVNSLLDADRDITIATVCEIVGVCPETIRNWGCNEFIADMKSKQRGIRLAQRNHNLYQKVEDYLAQKLEQHVKAGEVYQELGILRNVLWRNTPEITAYISERLRSHNKK